MPNTSIATGSFASRKEANQAVQRLVSAGFARNSIELHRHDDDEGYELEIHTRQENIKRAERLIHDASVPLYAVSQTASGVVQTANVLPFRSPRRRSSGGISDLQPYSEERVSAHRICRSAEPSQALRHRPFLKGSLSGLTTSEVLMSFARAGAFKSLQQLPDAIRCRLLQDALVTVLHLPSEILQQLGSTGSP